MEFIFSPFFPHPGGAYWHWFKEVFLCSKEELLGALKSACFLQEKAIVCSPWQKPCLKQFKEVFSLIKKSIQHNEIQKAVPAFFATADLKKINVWQAVIALLEKDSGKIYAFWSDKEVIIGSSPEILFTKKGLLLQTMALAGTARFASHNLLEDPKECLEHQLVVNGIKHILKPLGKVEVLPTFVDTTHTLKHLRADLRVFLKKDLSIENIVSVLHPTPALGGSPQKKAYALLKKLQLMTGQRGFFGSPFGVALKDEAYFVVAIRNMYVQYLTKKVFVGSGCGIVKESQIQSEWQELQIKREFIKKILL